MQIPLRDLGLTMWKSNFSRNYSSLFLVLCVGLSLFLCSCSKAAVIVPSQNSVTFTDALDRTVTVQKEPPRVAALLGSFADIWTLAGGSLCACAEDAWEDFGLNPPNALNLGGAHSPSLETLLASDPDFVIASASTASNVEMKEALENAGVTVAYFDVDCFEDYLAMLRICTRITGREDLYEQNGTALEQRIQTLKDRFVSADLSQTEKTVLLLRTSSTSVKAKGSRGTILGELLSDIGCVNIADNDRNLLETLSIESIMRQEPHHIFVVCMGSDRDAAINTFNRTIQDNPAFQTLDAVKNNRVHIMDKSLFNLKPNKRWAESYETLINIFLKTE